MIKLRKPSAEKVVTTTMKLAGEEFEIDLVPLTEEDRLNIFRKFRKKKSIHNPVTRAMEMLTYFDDDDAGFQKAADELLCKIIVDFRNIADVNGVPFDGKLEENKMLLGSVKVDYIEDITVVDESGQTAIIKQPRERYLRASIIDKAVELSSTVAEAEAKN